jgi:hypothetical protein
MYLTLLGRPTHWSEGNPGHAFMMISVETSNGPKEEAFGFYPATPGKRALIGWPGALDSEFQRHPDPFEGVTVSVRVPLTLVQSRSIYALVQDFNLRKYDLAESNCIDFVDRVAGVVGLPRPARYPLQYPEDYVKALKSNLDDRQAYELAQKESERQADAQREAQRIPPGWILCGCPAAHAAFGKWIGNRLYHDPKLVCP